MANEHDGSDRKFLGYYEGVVVDNVDPEKCGRVRIRIPGLIEDASAWAHPVGWPGAGTKKRGTYSPPPNGAEVGVWFKMGDIDHPRYACGFPGRGEQPDEVESSETSPEDAVKVFAHEGDRYKFVFDERPGKFLLQLRDKKTGDVIEIDGVGLGIRLKATSGMSLECDGAIDITGSSVTINGRQVTRNGKPI